MVFMVWKHVDGDDDRWLYLPALDLVKRIASKEKRTSFVGSDFLYEDVSGRNINADTHELVDTTQNYYVIKNTPKEPEAVEFAHFTMWVHRSTFLPIKIEYYNDKGEKYREYEALKVEIIQGLPTVTQSLMKDMRVGGETLLQYRNVQYDIGLPEEIFTERFLRRAPTQHLR
jgi:outer membrane lipoprotein-sorting protein